MVSKLPPNQKETRLFPVLHYGSVPVLDRQGWRLRVFGEVAAPMEWTWQDLQAWPRTDIVADIHCVTGWSKQETVWRGISTRTLWQRIQPGPQARFVMVHGANDFSANLPVRDFLAESVLLADEYDGKPLTPEHGGPLRLVVPQLYFWKSAKWVSGIELMIENRAGFWEERGYHMRGDPWQEERYW